MFQNKMSRLLLFCTLGIMGAILTTHHVQAGNKYMSIWPNAIQINAANTSQSTTFSTDFPQTECETAYSLADADPNESAEVIRTYWQGVELMRQGHWNEARSWFAGNLSRYPNSRHLHEGLAQVLWYLAMNNSKDPNALEYATRETVQAVELGLKFGKVRHTWLLAQTLGRTGTIDILENLFQKALRIAPTYETHLDYALGLSLMDAPHAETIYQQAIELQPEGTVDALAFYAEWLLDQKREREVIALIPSDTEFEYLYFLRGVAHERLGNFVQAQNEYTRVVDFSQLFPIPSQYRIPKSTAQSGIRFNDNISITSTDSQSRVGLSTLIWGEARGESIGGQRAVGWIVRNRVLRGSVGGCPYVNNSGATLAQKYKNVMCQSGQFVGMCSAWCSNPATTTCPRNITTDHSAYDVWYGYAPDPVPPGGYCPGGYNHSKCRDGICTPCVGVCWGGTYGFSNQGGLFNLGTSGACPTHFCAPTSKGKVCGNSGADNCFYTNP